MGLVGRGGDTGDGDFHFDAIVEAAEVDLAGCDAIAVRIEAQFAGGDDGDFELLNVGVGKARSIGKDAHSATGCGGEAFVVVEGEAEMERVFGHSQCSLARATSQASRQSGQ